MSFHLIFIKETMLSWCSRCFQRGSSNNTVHDEETSHTVPRLDDFPVVIEPLPSHIGPRIGESFGADQPRSGNVVGGRSVAECESQWTTFQDGCGSGEQDMPTANSSSVKPPPLTINTDAVVQPLSTPAQHEDYDRNRPTALAMSSHQILAMSEEERDEKVYKYLSPEEMWNVKEALRRIPPAIDVSETINVTTTDRSKDFMEYQKNRDIYLSMSDSDILQIPLIEIASYYPYLSAGEILDAYSRIERLKANAVASDLETFAISEESSAFLKRSWLPFSVELDAVIVIKDEVGKTTLTGFDLRNFVAEATDEQLCALHDDSLKKIEPYFSIKEMTFINEKRKTNV